MKQKILTILAAVALVLGMGGCSTEDNPTLPSVDVETLEQSLVGIWWDEYEYADVTEDGVPFTRALLAVKADADHTGCIYLGVFDDKSDEPVAVYGGPEEAGFKWQLKADGTIVLTDPVTGDSYTLARTRGEGGSYGEKMTDVSATNMAYTDGSVTVTNGDYSTTLQKADAGKEAEIEKTLATPSANFFLFSDDGTINTYTDANGVRREGIVVTLGGKKYLIATSNETVLPDNPETSTKTIDGHTYYTWNDACKLFANGKTDGTYTAHNVWRLPTKDELICLQNLSVTKGFDSTEGHKGYNWAIGSSSLFLPGAGYCLKGNKVNADYGHYWSSTPSIELFSYNLIFSGGTIAVFSLGFHELGNSVRLFCELTVDDGTIGNYKDANGMEREGIVVTLDSKKYLIATSNESDLSGITAEKNTLTSDGNTYYTWNNACQKFAGGKTDGSYTAANVWRMPTKDEITSLRNMCYDGSSNAWKPGASFNGGLELNLGSASLFLPATGDCDYGDPSNVGKDGLYWSSTPGDSDAIGTYAWRLWFTSKRCEVLERTIRDGFPVRLFCQLP